MTSSSFANQCPYNTSWCSPKIWYSDGTRSGPYGGWGRSLNLIFRIVPIVAPTG
jgi:hypothetical protein